MKISSKRDCKHFLRRHERVLACFNNFTDLPVLLKHRLGGVSFTFFPFFPSSDGKVTMKNTAACISTRTCRGLLFRPRIIRPISARVHRDFACAVVAAYKGGRTKASQRLIATTVARAIDIAWVRKADSASGTRIGSLREIRLLVPYQPKQKSVKTKKKKFQALLLSLLALSVFFFFFSIFFYSLVFLLSRSISSSMYRRSKVGRWERPGFFFF